MEICGQKWKIAEGCERSEGCCHGSKYFVNGKLFDYILMEVI